ncbi:alpha/beta-hydrolase [Ganoderma leucocontextum]|nr:alpha/beta-hydrolase [Ganoderma leucocontextum]
MNQKLYKETVVRRGHTYRYYFSPPAPQKPVLLFLHGFPSTSYDWRRQIAFFQPLGCGIIAPDLLGAGGTSKPLDPKEFRLNGMADDILDILDVEGIKKVVCVSHDWGSGLAARLCMLYPEIFHGFIWLGLGFMDPSTAPFDMEAAMAFARANWGCDAFAYWEFFTRSDAYEIIEKNVDSFLQLLYPEHPEEWATWILTRGKTAELIEGNIQLGKPSYLPEEEYQALRRELVSSGIRSALNWYNSQVQDIHLEDNINIPEERKRVASPSLACLALRDLVSRPTFTQALMTKYGTQVDYVEVDAAHWLHIERPEEVNAAMLRWLDTLAL